MSQPAKTLPAPQTSHQAASAAAPAASAAVGIHPEEGLDRGAIRALQLERLQWTVRHAYDNVELYRQKFDAVGVTPDDIRSLEDIQKLPFTTKDDLRQNYPFGMFAVPMDEVRRIHASSGTTGRPTVVGYTQTDLDNWADLVARSLYASGVRPGWRVHNAYGYGLFTGGLGAHGGIERLGCTVVPMSGGQTEKQVQLITDFQPDAIMCTPSYLLTIADAFEEAGLDPRESSLQVAICGAEPWTDAMRHELEERLGIKAVDIYGLSEVMGPGVGNECVETQDGPHIWEDHFLPEVINEDLQQVPDGVPGELVFTTLTKEAFPVIRYRTRDLTELRPGTARPGHRRITKITGRNDDMIILRGVNLFPTQIEEIALEDPDLSSHFILELTRRGRMDCLKVKIEPREGVSHEAVEQSLRTMRHHVKSRIGCSIDVEAVPHGSLPRSQGKLKRLYDLRDSGE